jgi:hypothetical protein
MKRYFEIFRTLVNAGLSVEEAHRLARLEAGR